mmetsp:Transcript_9045/g.23781  ORF Transcript_9045/g.23781 Transcript_9045/m.23781 type:complete len:257 (+) Transcript_9045:1166-1936(+)
MLTLSGSNMNSSGTSGASSGSSCSSWSLSSSSSCSSCFSSGSSSSSSRGGGGGGCCSISGSGGSICWSGGISARGKMASSTASLRSSAVADSRPSRAAAARAISIAYSSARWPWHMARDASVTRYSICLEDRRMSSRYSRARTMLVAIASVSSLSSSTKVLAESEYREAFITASMRSSILSGSLSAESTMAMRSSRCARKSPSSGLYVAMTSGLQSCTNEIPSRSTRTWPSEMTLIRMFATFSSSRLTSSMYSTPR